MVVTWWIVACLPSDGCPQALDRDSDTVTGEGHSDRTIVAFGPGHFIKV